VIITQGSEDVLVAFSDRPIDFRRYPVHQIPENQIVDTNGAGDAFVGGFLAYMAIGKRFKLCIEAGIHAGTEVIQKPGCTFRKENKFRL